MSLDASDIDVRWALFGRVSQRRKIPKDRSPMIMFTPSPAITARVRKSRKTRGFGLRINTLGRWVMGSAHQSFDISRHSCCLFAFHHLDSGTPGAGGAYREQEGGRLFE